MNKLELIQALKDAADLFKSETAAVVDIFLYEMAEELAKGGGSRSGDCVHFMLGNMNLTPVGIRKPGNGSRSSQRSFHFSSRERN